MTMAAKKEISNPELTLIRSWIERAKKVTLKHQVIQFATALYTHRWVDGDDFLPKGGPGSTRPPMDYPLTGSAGGYWTNPKNDLLVRIDTPNGRKDLALTHHQYIRFWNELPEQMQADIHKYLGRTPELNYRAPVLDHSRYACQLQALTALYLKILGERGIKEFSAY